jgi:hypothetical protein
MRTSYLHILHNPLSSRGPFVMAHAITIVLVMDFMAVIAKSKKNFSLFLRKFRCTLKLKKYHFSVKITYEHAALGHLSGGVC